MKYWRNREKAVLEKETQTQLIINLVIVNTFLEERERESERVEQLKITFPLSLSLSQLKNNIFN